MRLSIIAAMDSNRLIGKNNALPWHLPADLAHFKKITLGKTVLMGRKTYQSIGKPLPERRNIVISRNANFKAQGCRVVDSIDAGLVLAKNEAEVLIIGGASLYQQVLPRIQRLYITTVCGEFSGDAYFPEFNPDDFVELSRIVGKKDAKNQHNYYFSVLQKSQKSPKN